MTQPNDQERGSWTSASNAQADLLCAGRHLAQRGIPDTKNPDAEFGDKIHAALAAGKPDGLDARQEDIYDSFLKIEADLLVKYFGDAVKGKTSKPIVEQRYWAVWPDGLKHSGQVDRVHRMGTKALIVECKSLVGEIPESPRNMQLRDQACLFDMNNPLLTEVAVAVIQPLVTHKPDLCVYQRADLMRARDEMYQRVAGSNTLGAPRRAGAAQCKFCKAKPNCKEYAAYAGALVPTPASLVDVPVSLWTPEQRKEFADTFDVAQKWLDNCWSALEAGAMLDPNYVPGYTMKPGTPRGTIQNLQAVFDRASTMGVPLDKFLGCSTISKEALTELVRTASKAKGKGLTDKVKEVIGPDVKLSEVKSSLKKL
jgi:hypothetical protein